MYFDHLLAISTSLNKSTLNNEESPYSLDRPRKRLASSSCLKYLPSIDATMNLISDPPEPVSTILQSTRTSDSGTLVFFGLTSPVPAWLFG